MKIKKVQNRCMPNKNTGNWPNGLGRFFFNIFKDIGEFINDSLVAVSDADVRDVRASYVIAGNTFLRVVWT